MFNGRVFDHREIKVVFWDGKTNYKHINESTQEINKRVDEFGEWLDDHELPEELKIKKQEVSSQNGDDEKGAIKKKESE